jgi:hypothetical protein
MVRRASTAVDGAELRRNTATLAFVETLWLADYPATILRPKTHGGGDDDRTIECHAQAYDAPGFPNPHARR